MIRETASHGPRSLIVATCISASSRRPQKTNRFNTGASAGESGGHVGQHERFLGHVVRSQGTVTVTVSSITSTSGGRTSGCYRARRPRSTAGPPVSSACDSSLQQEQHPAATASTDRIWLA